MKKIAVIVILSILSLFLWASPCFEELEIVTLSLMASSASVPKLPLPGVTTEGDDIFPSTVTFTSSDVSLYHSSLTTKPEKCTLLESIFFSQCQNTSLMKQIQTMLLEAGFEKGDLVLDGTISIREEKEPDAFSLMAGKDLSSISLVLVYDLTLTERGKEWNVNADVSIKGDSKGNLVATSKECIVNGSKYKVELKYRLKESK